MHLRTTAEELARWLERAGGLWSVEGEPSIAKHLPQPAPAESLAEAVRAKAEDLVLLVPESAPFSDGASVASPDLVRAAHDIDGHSVFQLAWVAPDGTQRDSWLLAEHGSLAESGERKLAPTSSAAAMVEVLRNELRAGTPLIAKKPR